MLLPRCGARKHGAREEPPRGWTPKVLAHAGAATAGGYVARRQRVPGQTDANVVTARCTRKHHRPLSPVPGALAAWPRVFPDCRHFQAAIAWYPYNIMLPPFPVVTKACTGTPVAMARLARYRREVNEENPNSCNREASNRRVPLPWDQWVRTANLQLPMPVCKPRCRVRFRPAPVVSRGLRATAAGYPQDLSTGHASGPAKTLRN